MKNIHRMDGMNIELTTCCPLRCPQCYCTLEGGKHIDFELAKSKIDEASEHGVFILNLSGGETLCYPYLTELVSYASDKIKNVNVDLSGWHFNENVLKQLTGAGISGIYVSLNGSTESINATTRDGYDYAIHALKVMQEANFKNSYINWVMHSDNCDDFENVLSVAEKYNVSSIVVLVFKPDSSHKISSFPSGEQIRLLAGKIRSYRGSVRIMIESCFSQLLAVIKDTALFGNMNVGAIKGCRAGVYNYSISADGKYSPCRHLDYYEEFDSLDNYLEKSEIIGTIRSVEENKHEPCDKCRYSDYCKPCLAVNSKLHGELYIGHEICNLYKL